MLPANRGSIFHLGAAEGGDDGHHRGAIVVDHHGRNSMDTHQHVDGGQNNGRRRRVRDAVVVVGLQILVQRHHHPAQPCRVVLKQLVICPPARHRFLRACSLSLCRRELSSDKEVYMYRGDQGFCSEECRRRQILTDQERERGAMARRSWPSLPHHRRRHGQRLPPAIGAAPRRLLAAA